MRSGHLHGNQFLLGVSRLDSSEKARLIAVLDTKLSVKAKLIRHGNVLALQDGQRVVNHIRYYFHESQLHRLEKKSR